MPLTVGGGIREFTDANGKHYSALQVAAEYFRWAGGWQGQVWVRSAAARWHGAACCCPSACQPSQSCAPCAALCTSSLVHDRRSKWQPVTSPTHPPTAPTHPTGLALTRCPLAVTQCWRWSSTWRAASRGMAAPPLSRSRASTAHRSVSVCGLCAATWRVSACMPSAGPLS